MRIWIIIFGCVVCLGAWARAANQTKAPPARPETEARAHVHGAAELSIAFEGLNGVFEFSSPSDSIIGFEYEAKTEKDKKATVAALLIFERHISEMIVFEEPLKCKITKDKLEVVYQKPLLGAPSGTHSSGPSGTHSEVKGFFQVLCEKSPKGSKIEFNIQKFFPRLRDVDVQVLIGSIQKSIEVKKVGTIVELDK